MRWSACGSLIVVLAAMAVVIHGTRSLGVAVPAIVKVYSGFLPAAPRSIAPSSVELSVFPAVATVETLISVSQPTQCVIHLADWHFVPRDDFAADIRAQLDEPLAELEIDSLYAEHLAEVQRVQSDQREVLRWLIMHFGVRRVFCEGLTDRDLPVYQIIVDQLRRRAARRQDLLGGESAGDETVLRVGAAGQLLAADELAEVLPAEEETAFERANPLAGDRGEMVFDQAVNNAREAAIFRRLLSGGPLVVVVLGGGHDLSDQVKRLGDGKCQYLKVMVKSYPVEQYDGPAAFR